MPSPIQKFVEAKPFGRIFFSIGILLVVVLIFEAGVMVGFHKASYSYASGNHYYENINGPRGMMPMGMRDRDFTSGHGALGKIIKITLPTITVETPEGNEKTITISDQTTIRRFRNTITSQELKVDDFIVVLGSPQSNGTIQAKLIRTTPPPNELIGTSSKQF